MCIFVPVRTEAIICIAISTDFHHYYHHTCITMGTEAYIMSHRFLYWNHDSPTICKEPYWAAICSNALGTKGYRYLLVN